MPAKRYTGRRALHSRRWVRDAGTVLIQHRGAEASGIAEKEELLALRAALIGAAGEGRAKRQNLAFSENPEASVPLC